MDVFEAVRTVLAVRQFKSDPVPAEVVRQIVESGHLTASSINGQPWHFIVVEDKAMLGQLGALARSGPYIAQAPLAIIVAVAPSPYGMSDASRAIQSMVLTAWAAGVGSNWVGFANLAEVNPVVGLPDDHQIIAILPFGYPVNLTSKGKKVRKPLGEIASRERFGQPFE
ncbi:MAG: nitroreductase family protein [Ktedonobacterales bacterium]|nr:nitroreductase family protein [Ktedonobacterales bacterium]